MSRALLPGKLAAFVIWWSPIPFHLPEATGREGSSYREGIIVDTVSTHVHTSVLFLRVSRWSYAVLPSVNVTAQEMTSMRA
ncbi:hypothetical protein BDR06DRAFT_959748 [Suillus hirtellus]|nr:hypothetical protein BDR06DRAFT_959748 [Suillus hirtellus]